MRREHVIITGNLKLILVGFTQSFENIGGNTFVKYVSLDPTYAGIVTAHVRRLDKPNDLGVSSSHAASVGDEIIVIGEAIHFNTREDSSLKGILSGYLVNWTPH